MGRFTKKTFPSKNWFLFLDKDNWDIVNEWKTDPLNNLPYRRELEFGDISIYENGASGVDDGMHSTKTKITTDEFKEFVLGISSHEEDMSYLIPIINKLQ